MKTPRRKSAAPAARRSAGRTAVHLRQDESATTAATARIHDRKHLADLAKWVGELHTTHGKSFRWIAKHSTRGESAYGYFQQIAARAHLRPRPTIRPCFYDWQDVRRMIRIVREYSDTTEKLFSAVNAFDLALAELQRAAVALVVTARDQQKDIKK